MDAPIYYSFKEFQKNYYDDFENWKKEYPDGSEDFFLKEIEIKYREYCFQKNNDWVFDDTFNVYLNGESGYPEDYYISFSEYVILINNIYHNYLIKNGITPKNLIEYEDYLIYSEDVFEHNDNGVYTDYKTFLKSLPFLKFEKEILPLHSPYFFEMNEDEVKFKNFGFSCVRILKFVDDKLKEIKSENENTHKANLKIEDKEIVKEKKGKQESLGIKVYDTLEMFKDNYFVDYSDVAKDVSFLRYLKNLHSIYSGEINHVDLINLQNIEQKFIPFLSKSEITTLKAKIINGDSENEIMECFSTENKHFVKSEFKEYKKLIMDLLEFEQKSSKHTMIKVFIEKLIYDEELKLKHNQQIGAINNNPLLPDYSETTTNKKIKFHGNNVEFVELVKALIENGNLKGTQKEIFKTLSEFFEIEVKHPDKTISDIKKRNNGSETLFLDRLKESMITHITKTAEKKIIR